MTNTDPKTVTILIGIIQLKSGDQYRVEITNFTGAYTIGIRRWYLNDDGELHATRTGINVAVEHLPALRRLVSEASKRADADGLIPKKKKGE